MAGFDENLGKWAGIIFVAPKTEVLARLRVKCRVNLKWGEIKVVALVIYSIEDPMVKYCEKYGFRRGRSTTTCNSHFLYESFKNGSLADVIGTDLNKIFDSANNFFLNKFLKKSGFSEPFLSWLKYYLGNRHQWVKVFGFKSNAFLASSGVPQRSHLSPLLFSLIIQQHMPYFAP